MKRILTLCMCLLLIGISVGCSARGTANPSVTELSDGTIYTTNEDGGRIFSVNSLPFEMEYKEVNIPLHSVVLYDNYISPSHRGYVIVSLGRASLSNDDIYWMTKSEVGELAELDVNLYLTSEKNGLDSESLSSFGVFYDADFLYFFFETEKVRYDFENAETSVQVIIMPSQSANEKTRDWYQYDSGYKYIDQLEDMDPGMMAAYYHILKTYA